MSKLMILVFDAEGYDKLHEQTNGGLDYYAQFALEQLDESLAAEPNWVVDKDRLTSKKRGQRLHTIEAIQKLSDFITNWRTFCATRKEDRGSRSIHSEEPEPPPADSAGATRA